MTVRVVGGELDRFIDRMKGVRRLSPQEARFTIRDALRDTSVFARRLVQDEINIKVASFNARRKIFFPERTNQGGTVEGRLEFSESAPPPATAFTGTRQLAGSRNRKGGVRVAFRKGGGSTIVTGAFIRQAARRPSDVDPKDRTATRGRIPYVRARRDGARQERVGRKPYFVLTGPSPLGLLESKPGFLNRIDGFLRFKLVESANRRYRSMLQRLGLLNG